MSDAFAGMVRSCEVAFQRFGISRYQAVSGAGSSEMTDADYEREESWDRVDT